MTSDKTIYLDWAATTPLCEEAASAMGPFLCGGAANLEFGGNANSLHSVGRRAFSAMEQAREGLSRCIGGRPDELFFTVTVNPRSAVCNEHTGDIKLPKGCRLTCLIRNNDKIYPDMYTKFQANDRAVLYTYNVNKNKLEKMFGTSIDIDV